MKLIKGLELEEVIKNINIAANLSKISPCSTDKRGVIIVNERGYVIGQGVNGPPKGSKCEPSYCGDSCRVPAAHAEVRAIFDAYKNNHKNLSGSIMYHAKTEEGVLQNSRKPRCAECSKYILDSELKGFILKHEEGYTFYDSIEFHIISLENHRKRNLK